MRGCEGSPCLDIAAASAIRLFGLPSAFNAMHRTLITIVSFASWTCTSLPATTYHVSPGGDDSRDGLTAATAWRSVGKVNAARLLPGDEVRFECGGVWREALSPTSGGAPGNPVIFRSYGTGQAPLFDGSDEVAWESLSGIAGDGVFAVLLDGAFLRQPSAWRLDGTCIRLAQTPAANQKLQVIRRENMVNLQGLRHLVLRGLAVDATARMHGGYGFRVEMCEDITLEDCLATRCGKHHFGVINSTAVVLRRCHASLAMPDQGVGGASAFVSYSDKRHRGDTSRYEDCVVENYADATGQGQYPAFVTHGEGIGEVVMVGLKSKGAGFSFNNAESGALLTLTDSEISGGGLTLNGTNCRVKGVTLLSGVLTLNGSRHHVTGCRITGMNPGFEGYQSAVVNHASDCAIEECEITLAPDAKPFNAAIALVNPQSRLTWTNCRINTPGCAVKAQFPDVRSASCTAKGNRYPAGATFLVKGSDRPLTLEDWRTFGLDRE